MNPFFTEEYARGSVTENNDEELTGRKEAHMSDSKLNKKFRDAVRTGGRGAERAARSTARVLGSTWSRMRTWQKVLLLLCIVFWIASVILGAVTRRVTGGLIDQSAAERWASGQNYAQVSAFLAEGSGASEDTAKALYTGLMLDLQTDAIALSETQVENGASLVEECYCGMGSADLSASGESVTVNAIGVAGSFFNFHPLDLIDGYYFADDDLMHDRVLLDDQTAWRLFGSPNVVGMAVNIGGTPHYIAGVFRQPAERFYKESGMGSYLIFMSYDSLCKYTDSSTAEEENGGKTEDRSDLDGMDALMPPAVPQTAAYMPMYVEKESNGKNLSAEEESSEFDDSDSGGDADSKEPVSETVEENGKDSKEEELSDDPVGENLGSHGGTGQGASGKNGRNVDEVETEEINRSRLTCYEVVMPNPVQGYALRKVRSRLEQIPFPMEKAAIVDNTSRYDVLRLAALMAQPGVRSMQTAPIRYPYWENVALAWEDVLIPFAFLWMILRFAPFAFLLWLLIWYATHKSWTVGGVINKIWDTIYDRQSERIYGKKSDRGLPVTDQGSLPAQTALEGDAPAASEEAASEDDPAGLSQESLEDDSITDPQEDAAEAAAGDSAKGQASDAGGAVEE